MNYCPACRRHLNGALACAGCGTPAEYLIPAAPAGAMTAPDAEPPPAVPATPTALADVYADSLVVLSGPARGRAGARRRAGHRRRRRTVLTVGLGLVLATGASVAMARMAADGERSDRASEVVLTDNSGPQQPEPLPSLTPAAPSRLPSGKGPAAATASAGGTKAAGTGRATGGSGSPGAVPPGSASGAPGPTPGASGAGGGVPPTSSGSPAPSGSGTAQPSASAGPTHGPKPKPSKTPSCWLFFCV